MGDWHAPILVLAKDAAPTGVIRELARLQGIGAWRHAERRRGDRGGWRTNERLAELSKCVPGSKLYGSALANLLYDDPRWSRALPGFCAGPLHGYLADVLRWVIDSMPNLNPCRDCASPLSKEVCGHFGAAAHELKPLN